MIIEPWLLPKEGCSLLLLPHAKFGPNRQREDAPHFIKSWLGRQKKDFRLDLCSIINFVSPKAHGCQLKTHTRYVFIYKGLKILDFEYFK